MRQDIRPICHFPGIPFGEGPSFDRDGTLYVCVRRDGWIAKVTPDGRVSRFLTTGQQPNGTCLHRDGRLFFCDIKMKKVLVARPDGSYETFVDACDGVPFIGPNDLTFDSRGTLYLTDPGHSSIENPIGAVYRATPDGIVTRIASGLIYPNGIAISADDRALYVAETFTHTVRRIELGADGAAGPPDVFAVLPREGLGLDGMAFDATGNLYVTHHGPGTIDVLDPAGRLIDRVPAGGSSPTNCAFHGTALYVTEDQSACVQRLELGVRGQPLVHER